MQDLGDLLDRGKTDTIGPSRLNDIDNALEGARHYLGKIRTDPAQAVPHRRHVATMHILDHLFRLSHRCKQQARIAVLRTDKQLRPFADQLKDVAASIEPKDLEVAEMELDSLRSALLEQSHAIRAAMVEAASVAGASTEATIVKLDAIRWLHRVSYHYWRIAHHLLFLEPSPDGSIRRAQMPEIGTESNVISQSKNCTKYQS